MLVSPSTFAEEWTRRSTAGRPREVWREVSIGELEALLRERERRSRSSRGKSTAPPRRTQSFVMPVAGVDWDELQNSFGDPRSGGRRHMGIDIFAPRWTEVLAATSGTLTAIDFGQRSGRSLWLVGRDGRSYFYAHLQAWAEGVSEGMSVAPGERIGYVGNSGNASGSPTHLHFEIRDRGRAVNPHPILARAEPVGASGQVASNRARAQRDREERSASGSGD